MASSGRKSHIHESLVIHKIETPNKQTTCQHATVVSRQQTIASTFSFFWLRFFEIPVCCITATTSITSNKLLSHVSTTSTPTHLTPHTMQCQYHTFPTLPTPTLNLPPP